jgi:hypothetical protein
MAKCIWPRAAWIIGDGAFASVSYCGRAAYRGRYVTVELHRTAGGALAAKGIIDATACGGHCTRQHAVVELVLP